MTLFEIEDFYFSIFDLGFQKGVLGEQLSVNSYQLSVNPSGAGLCCAQRRDVRTQEENPKF
jgi:hypothetical protein